MSLFVTYAGADQGNTSVRLGALGLAASADSTVSFGSIIFDDSTGTRTITGWKPFTIDEPDCTAAPRLFTGYVADRRYNRGPYRTAAGRWIDTTIVDQNAVLGLRLITGSDGKRPAETHIQRIDWLLGSAYLSGLIVDDGLVYRGNPRPFDEADYRGQYAFDVLADISAPIFQTFFATYDQTTHRVGLFFNQPNATTNTSTLTISNVLTDVDSVSCFAPLIDAEMVRDPSEVYSHVRMTHKYGSVLATRTSTATAFISRGLQVNNDRIGLASALVMSESLLDRSADEADTITCTVQLPRSKVGLIDAGMRLGVRFSHLPGYETLTYSRVTRRNITQSEGTDQLYDVQLELSTHGLSPGSGGGSPGPFVPAELDIVQHKLVHLSSGGTNNITLDQAPAENNYLHIGVTQRGTGPIGLLAAFTASPDGGFGYGSDSGVSGYRIVGAGETATIAVRSVGDNGIDETFTIVELAGVGVPTFNSEHAVTTGTKPSTVDANTFTPTAGLRGVAIQLEGVHCSDWAGNGASSITAQGAWAQLEQRSVNVNGDEHPIHWIGSQIITSATGSPYSTTQTLNGAGNNFGGWGGQVLFFPAAGAGGVQPPDPGQWVFGEIPTPAPDGTTVTFTTAFPYWTGSLRVRVDGVPILNGLTETNPATGSFTLDFAPKAASGDTRAEIVKVDYQGR